MSSSSRAGEVAGVWIYPVKSLGGTEVAAAEVRTAGLVGDRTHAVVDAGTGERLSVKAVPRLGELTAAPGQAVPVVTAPGEPAGARVPAEVLSDYLDRPVELAAAEVDGGLVDASPVHLVSEGAIQAAAEGDVPEGCSADDPRANLVLRLSGAVPGERDWVGHSLRIGDAVLSVTRTPKHCLGVYAEVVTAGRIRTGDPVDLLD